MVDLQGQAPGVVLEGALGVGQGLEFRRIAGRVGRPTGFLVLSIGQGAGFAGEPLGLLGLGLEEGAAEVGGLADQGIDLVAYGVLPGLEPVELGAVAGGFGLVGDLLLACGQRLEPSALGVILAQFIQLVLELLQAVADGAEPVRRLLEIGEATLRVVVLPGAVEHRAAALGLELGDLTGGPGERPEPRVLVEIAGEELQAVDHRACVRLAVLDRLLTGPVPSAFAVPGGFGGVAQPFGLLPIGRRGLLQRVELGLHGRAPEPAQLGQQRLGAGDDRDLLRGCPYDVGTARGGPIVGDPEPIAQTVARLETQRMKLQRRQAAGRSRAEALRLDRDVAGLRARHRSIRPRRMA